MSSDEMQVRLNLKKLAVFCVVSGFCYLAVVIWTSGRDFPEVEVELRDIISYAVLAAEVGGHAVSQIYGERNLNTVGKGKTAEGKEELLTKADLVSNYLILDVLQRFPGLHVVSEEKDTVMTESEAEKYRPDKYELWLKVRELVDQLPFRKYNLSKLAVWIDPLDATQEFTEDLVQYVTVMVCVASEGEPIFGAIYRPFSNETVFGLNGFGIVNSKQGKWNSSVLNNVPKKIVVSRSHAGPVQRLALKAFGTDYVTEAAGGSGYKVLRLLNGTAELYVHRTAIKKWDTCAGDALIRSVGGTMMDLDGNPLDYSRKADVVNDKGLLVAIRHPYTFYQKWSQSVNKG